MYLTTSQHVPALIFLFKWPKWTSFDNTSPAEPLWPALRPTHRRWEPQLLQIIIKCIAASLLVSLFPFMGCPDRNTSITCLSHVDEVSHSPKTDSQKQFFHFSENYHRNDVHPERESPKNGNWALGLCVNIRSWLVAIFHDYLPRSTFTKANFRQIVWRAIELDVGSATILLVRSSTPSLALYASLTI